MTTYLAFIFDSVATSRGRQHIVAAPLPAEQRTACLFVQSTVFTAFYFTIFYYIG